MLDVGHLDEADHRRIARRMDLLHFEDDAPGMVFWHDRGRRIFRQLREAARRHVRRRDYAVVGSPQLLRRPVWEASGHRAYFGEGMFAFDPPRGHPAALKPVNCPCHLKIAARRLQSYRDLPMRLAEFGMVHRDERSGSLHGLFRLRQFHQDDGHVLCRPGAAAREIGRFCSDLSEMYAAFGIEADAVALGLRPDRRLGDDARWERAEDLLRKAANDAGLEVEPRPGEGAFYGPKLEWYLEDHRGREWQVGSIQLDPFMPERFGLEFADDEDDVEVPVLLHRAIYGSAERFLGLLLEHCRGKLPVWLAPVQAVVLPISEEQCRYAERLAGDLRQESVRAELRRPDRSLGGRIARARKSGIPYLLIVGEREVEDRSVAVRRGDDQESMARDRAIRHLAFAAEAPV